MKTGILALTTALAASVSLGISVVAAAPQPNIVHILTDDLGWQDIACYYRALHGKESVYETPHMDRIAQNGKRFMQAYSPAPTCAPSRAAYMAGQYTTHTGVLHVMGGRPARIYHPAHAYIDPYYPSRLSLETPIIADVLKEAGYSTAHFQKWHFGGRSKGYPGPLDYGFDFSWSWEGLHYNDPELYDPKDPKTADYEGIWRPMSPDRVTGFASSYDPTQPYALDPNDDDRPFDAVVDITIRWMDKVKDQGKPFFVNFCPSFVHGPFSTRDRKRLAHYCEKMGVPFPTDPGRIADMQPGQKNPYYAAMLDSLDWQVGKLVEFLETTDDPRNPGHKLIETTYIMVSSDNGGLEASPIRNGKDKGQRETITDNRPLRGGKLTLFEGGIRIPFIIQGPGIQAGSVNETPINLIDLFPTYMAMAGVKPTMELDLDGCNVLPVLLGQTDEAKFADGRVRDTLFWHYPSVMPSSSIIRKGNWKLRWNHAPEVNRLPEVMLYQLYNDDGSVADLGETKNLADAEPKRRDTMLAELKAWVAKYDAPLPYKNAQQASDKRLEGAAQVPAVLEKKMDGARVELLVESGAGISEVVEAKLLYTTNGSKFLWHNPHQVEWFDVPAEINGGTISAIAAPGMTHGVFFLRDENGFLICSEALPPIAGANGTGKIGVEMLSDAYAYRPGLISLIDLAVAAEAKATQVGLDVAALNEAIESARGVAATPVEEKAYALAMRGLRYEIRLLDVPEAKLPVLHQFANDAWAARVEPQRVSARGENAPRETAQHAFDGNPKTKWLDFSPEGSWIEYDFFEPTGISSYAITSADHPEARDPKEWQLLGSNDGKSWTTLDRRTGEQWSLRQETRSFNVSHTTAYRFYRLNITAVRDLKNANSVQIAEIEFRRKPLLPVEKARFIQHLEAGEKQTVVTFGTSLTAVGSWVDQMRTVLEQSYPGLSTVINDAQGGANSAWGKGALDEKVLKHNPDTVFIEFSVNDAVARRQTSVAHARGNLDNMIERIWKQNPECEIILQVMNPAVGYTGRDRPNLAAYNQIYRDAAKDHGLRLIDHYPGWAKLLDEEPGRFLRYVPDGIHPVRKGALAVSTPVVLKGVGAPAGKPEASSDTPCWNYLFRCLIDANKDQEVSRDEFNAFWRGHFEKQDADNNGELLPSEYGPAVLYHFVDANNDGRILPDEYLAAYQGIFDEFDLNQDQVLCRDEH